VKRLAYFVVLGALTCAALLFSGELLGVREQPRIVAAAVEARVEAQPVIAEPALPARQVRVVLPAPFEATP
jgi:hypothetical protein